MSKDIVLTNESCFDLLLRLKDKSVDLVLIDKFPAGSPRF